MKDSTNTIATKLADQFEVDGNALKLKAGAYDSTLPETFGETAVDQAKGVHAHDKSYIPGFTKAAGEQAVDVLKANKQFAHVTAETQVGNSNVTVMVERSATINIPAKTAGEPVTTRDVTGYSTVRISTKGGAEVKHVRDHIASLAADKL